MRPRLTLGHRTASTDGPAALLAGVGVALVVDGAVFYPAMGTAGP